MVSALNSWLWIKSLGQGIFITESQCFPSLSKKSDEMLEGTLCWTIIPFQCLKLPLARPFLCWVKHWYDQVFYLIRLFSSFSANKSCPFSESISNWWWSQSKKPTITSTLKDQHKRPVNFRRIGGIKFQTIRLTNWISPDTSQKGGSDSSCSWWVFHLVFAPVDNTVSNN